LSSLVIAVGFSFECSVAGVTFRSGFEEGEEEGDEEEEELEEDENLLPKVSNKYLKKAYIFEMQTMKKSTNVIVPLAKKTKTLNPKNAKTIKKINHENHDQLEMSKILGFGIGLSN
jgi:hypothetical protein